MPGAADVLVIGGGPAGATAARTLALEGRRVCLLDRTRFLRNKPSGGAISMRALRRPPDLSDALERIPIRRMSRLYLEAPSGAASRSRHTSPPRSWYDASSSMHCCSISREAGAEVVEGVDVSRARESHEGVCVGARDGREFEPVGGPLPRTATARVLLAGDAAGFVNGIRAEGIYYAMVSGHLAGRSAATGRTDGYERSWRAEIPPGIIGR